MAKIQTRFTAFFLDNLTCFGLQTVAFVIKCHNCKGCVSTAECHAKVNIL